MTPSGPRPVVFVCRDPVTGPVVDQVHAKLEAIGVEVVRGPHPGPHGKLVYPKESYQELFSRADAMMFSAGSICSREVMLSAPRLRGIVNPGVGLDTVDVKAATELGILVGHGAIPESYIGMAEATVMLILALSYQLARSERVLRENLPRPALGSDGPRMLRGKTVGIVGLGRIGRGVAERLGAFGVEVLATQPRLRSPAPSGVQIVGLQELLGRSDFVSLHVTLNSETRRLIGAREIAGMKRGAYLINTARGAVVDEAALCTALQEGRIAGAALDTFEVEPLPADSPLRNLGNVLLTPHMVGNTAEAFEALIAAAVENITRLLAGNPPLYCKNPEAIAKWRQRIGAAG